MSVVVGAHNIFKAEASQTRHQIKRIVVHEKYLEQKPLYDIMLIQLSTNITYNDVSRPICVDASFFPPHTTCVVSGWGYTEFIGRTLLILLTPCTVAQKD